MRLRHGIASRTFRRGGRLLLGVAIATWILFPGPGAAATQTFKCSISTLNDVLHEWCKRFAARLERRTHGQLKGQVFPAGQLGLGPRQVEGMQLGTIEAHMVPPEFLIGVDPRFQILTAPFLFQDLDHAYRVLSDRDFAEKFFGLAAQKGFKGVSLIPTAPASFVSRTPIRVPGDLRGRKVRVLATPIETAMMAALGATGVPMALGEVLVALQQGAVDAVQSSLAIFIPFKYYDVAKYHTNTNHYLITSIGMVSQKWYDNLPVDLQRAVIEEGQAVQPELLGWTKNFYGENAKIWKEKAGVGWIDLDAGQRAAFRRQMDGVDDQVAGQVPALKEWLALVRAKSQQHAR